MGVKILKEFNLPKPPDTVHSLRAVFDREKVELIWFVADAIILVEKVVSPYIVAV